MIIVLKDRTSYRVAKRISNIQQPQQISLATEITLFKRAIAPIATYGINIIWDKLTITNLSTIEKVKARYLKRILWIGKSTPSRLRSSKRNFLHRGHQSTILARKYKGLWEDTASTKWEEKRHMARFLHDSRLEAAKLRITTHSDKICNARFSSQTVPKPKIPPTGRRMRVQSVREIPCSKLQRKDNLNNKTRTRINRSSLCTLCTFLFILESVPTISLTLMHLGYWCHH